MIVTADDQLRCQSFSQQCSGQSLEWLIEQANALDQFRRDCDNLYQRVRALFFLSALYRYQLPRVLPVNAGKIPVKGFQHLLNRRFAEAIDDFLLATREDGQTDAISSALANAYQELAFQTLADQVRKSVRTFRGNQWMFRIGHPADQPLRISGGLIRKSNPHAPFPILRETTAVRMDLTHSAWSDIFFLGMDFPEGARVMNVSVDLGLRGKDAQTRPPIETYLRVIDRPVLRLASVDLQAIAEISSIDTVFDFARDHLGLIKAAVIASGLVPPQMEGCGRSIQELFNRMIGPGLGLEIVSKVNDIPKGSRLAVSTNLLGSLISVCMRATGQVNSMVGPLQESDRRTVAARAILGEWIGGSGGGWQDSGGVWPGIKLISGKLATADDPEFGISRGCLLPEHHVLDRTEISESTRRKLSASLVLVHGGMAQNVGPILEMVTEKYLLREPAEWSARQQAIKVLDEITAALQAGDIRRLGAATTNNFFGPLQTIIPWCADRFTEMLIAASREKFADKFWGFWMLGGMAGGGMGFMFDPTIKSAAQDWLLIKMRELKKRFEAALPFAMDPVVYDFSINEQGSSCELLEEQAAAMPDRYYALSAPEWLRADPRSLSRMTRLELERFGSTCLRASVSSSTVQSFLSHILPTADDEQQVGPRLQDLLKENGFDRETHERIRQDILAGRVGLAQNRLPVNVLIEDVRPGDVIDTRLKLAQEMHDLGAQAITDGKVAIVTLAAGVGSRWTEGAGVVKALHPFCRFAGRHRSFLEVHIAKSKLTNQLYGPQCAGRQRAAIPHIVTTSYMTDRPLRDHLAAVQHYGYPGGVCLSQGKSVGLRMIPTIRDLNFYWEEMPQQALDEQQEKMRTSLRSALVEWARSSGEATDYTDNLPAQSLHPVGHWYEIPNMLRSGLLSRLLKEQPQLNHLMLHNIDTLGANIDPSLLGLHLTRDHCMDFEVIPRRLEDRGGGLARVNGQVRILEGLAIPNETDEFKLSYYNSMTTWINIDRLLSVFGLDRNQLDDAQLVQNAIRKLSMRIPSYATIKFVKKRWGNGQEDVFPVSQFEKLWSDMSSLTDVDCGYFVVPIQRGQQLKEQSELDGWLRDGSADYVNQICDWSE
jgi:hypothetical protein